MARKKNKLCPACHTVFQARKDARTCSDRCRKRLQRASDNLQQELQANWTVAEISALPRQVLAYQPKPRKVMG